MEAVIRSYHVYIPYAWDAPIRKALSCERDVGNIHDSYVPLR